MLDFFLRRAEEAYSKLLRGWLRTFLLQRTKMAISTLCEPVFALPANVHKRGCLPRSRLTTRGDRLRPKLRRPPAPIQKITVVFVVLFHKPAMSQSSKHPCSFALASVLYRGTLSEGRGLPRGARVPPGPPRCLPVFRTCLRCRFLNHSCQHEYRFAYCGYRHFCSL